MAIKEFHDELLNLVTIQDKYEKIYPIDKQQVAEIVNFSNTLKITFSFNTLKEIYNDRRI